MPVVYIRFAEEPQGQSPISPEAFGTTEQAAEKRRCAASCNRTRLQSLLQNSLKRQEVSGHEFTRAVKGFFSLCGFSRGKFFKTLTSNVEFFSKLFSRAGFERFHSRALAPVRLF
jgi:hypothetical protein